MKILLLGNGFDLHYHLPTKYNNFLHTVEYLMRLGGISDPITVGDVFSGEKLTNKDNFIKKCYEKNKTAFDSVTLDFSQVVKMINLADKNMWFKYLLDSFNKDVGWIDFELEIKKVLSIIKPLFLIETPWLTFQTTNSVLIHMLKYFGFFTTEIGSGAYDFKREYLFQEPLGSKNLELDVNKIIETIYKELCDLAEMLKIYLSEFVEKAMSSVTENDLNKWLERYGANQIISFNYTNTYEQLFSDGNVIHIHGSNNNRIILGVDPDGDDEIDSVDTTLLPFKKYYQRVVLKTDIDYLATIELLEQNVMSLEKTFLTVIGHSLDETDKDVITELFRYATDINVLYYDDESLKKHINNLINIYGKNGFDELRYKKRLTFIPLSEEIDQGKVLNDVFESAWLNAINNYR